MSRIVKIEGTQKIQNIELAKEAISESGKKYMKIKDNIFIFEEYDYYDGIGKQKDIEIVENLYKQKYQNHLKEQIVQNAKKQGYKVKKERREDNSIKLVLQR